MGARPNSPVTTDAAAVSGSWQSASLGDAAESLPPSWGQPRCAMALRLLGAHGCLWTRPAPTGEGERIRGTLMPGSRFPRHAEAGPAHTPRRGVATEHLLEGSGRGTLKCKGETETQDMGKGGRSRVPPGQGLAPRSAGVAECPDSEWRPPPPGSSPGLKKEFLLPPPHSLLLGRK